MYYEITRIFTQNTGSNGSCHLKKRSVKENGILLLIKNSVESYDTENFSIFKTKKKLPTLKIVEINLRLCIFNPFFPMGHQSIYELFFWQSR